MGSLEKLVSLEVLNLERTNMSGPLQNIGKTLNNLVFFCATTAACI